MLRLFGKIGNDREISRADKINKIDKIERIGNIASITVAPRRRNVEEGWVSYPNYLSYPSYLPYPFYQIAPLPQPGGLFVDLKATG